MKWTRRSVAVLLSFVGFCWSAETSCNSNCARSVLTGQCKVGCGHLVNVSQELEGKLHKLHRCAGDDEGAQSANVLYVDAEQFGKMMKRMKDTGDNGVTRHRCTLVNFYTTDCPFSAQFMEHYNELGRHFKDILVMAVDMGRMTDSSYVKLGFQFGIAGTPTLILFAQGAKPVARLEAWQPLNLPLVADFLVQNTDLKKRTIELKHLDDHQGDQLIADAQQQWLLCLAVVLAVVSIVYVLSMSQTVQRLRNALVQDWTEMQEGALEG